MRLRVTGLLGAAILMFAAVALAGQPDPGAGARTYVPSETRVALLPFVNLTGEDMEEVLDDVEMADHVAAASFLGRGFPLVGDTEVLAAMAEAGMPVHDRAERTPEQLSALARKVNARLVVSGLLLDKRSTLRAKGAGLFTVYKKEGRAAAGAQVWDEAAKGFVTETTATGVTDSGSPFVVSAREYSGLRARALEIAVRNSLAELLEPYPAVAGQAAEPLARKAYRAAMAEALAIAETKWDPKQTEVLVLPFLDETKAERRDAESARVAEEASACAAQEFAKCGFQVLPGEQVAAAAEKAGVALADEKARTRSAIRALGEAAGAEVVVMGSFLLSVLDRGGRIVKIEVKVFDMATGRYVTATAGSSASASRGRAVSGAVYHALRDCLSRYRR
jgi:TolB-like protein